MSPINQKVQQIITAPEDQLRTALKVLCSSDPETCERVWEALLEIIALDAQPRVKALKRKADDETAEDEAPIEDAKRPRLIDDVHHCVQCDQTFRESDNRDDACLYHPGGLKRRESSRVGADAVTEESEPIEDHEIWVSLDDWDGEMDTEEMRDYFPEAFLFPCCRQNSMTEGCRYSRHWAADDERGVVPFPDARDTAGDSKDAAIEISDDEEQGLGEEKE